MGATPLLLHQKRETFWQTKVESERATPRRLWQSIDSLIGRGHDIVPLSTSIDAPKLHRYFDEKIAGVRASTAHAAPPSYVAAPSHCEFPAFRVLTNDDVIAAICKLPDKQCATDPLTTNLLKDKINVDVRWCHSSLNCSKGRCHPGDSIAFPGCIHHSNSSLVAYGPHLE